MLISTVEIAKDGIGELEYRSIELTQPEQQRENRLEKSEQCPRHPCNNTKRSNIGYHRERGDTDQDRKSI